jgi:GDP/UDP-N,N'-diacetylbacillosamine 2-epimerase (hydrolysing)
MKRKICVVTGARSDFGLLRFLMEDVKECPSLELQVIVTGMHLLQEFGSTYIEVEKCFDVDYKVDTLLTSDTPVAITRSMGYGLIGMADAFDKLSPEIVVLLGDRFEILPAAIAAVMKKIPLAHIHGGETTEGAIDESLRHAITKLANIHFVAAESYRRRVIQMGESPERVFMVGGLGVDAIDRITFLERAELEKRLNLTFNKRNLLITFHPATLESESSAVQMQAVLDVLDGLTNTSLIFTFPNADTGGRNLMMQVKRFAENRPHVFAYESMGQQGYLSCLRQMDGIIGNSSSGLLEAPALGVPTVNIGSRQKGRLVATSVINCDPERDEIARSIEYIYDPEFRSKLQNTISPYGKGGASNRILEVLKNFPLNGLLSKPFHNIDPN